MENVEINIYAVVDKIVGPIMPVGESNADSGRLENLNRMITLADQLLSDIEEVANSHNNGEHSMKVLKERAQKYLRNKCGELCFEPYINYQLVH